MPPHYWQDIRVLGVSAAAVATVTALLATPRVRDSFTDSLTSLATSLGFFKQHYDADLSFEEFLERQAEISWNHLRANINPRGTAPGCIVASPSRRKPDYWYQMSSFTVLAYTRDLLLVCVSYWTRDSALVMRTVLQRWKLSEPGSEDEKQLRQILFDFVNATIDMQHRDTPSGGFRTGGLGEVKFYVNREPYRGEWGRPQRDGPALRASLLISFARGYTVVNNPSDQTLLFDKLWHGSEGAVKADLDYVASEWKKLDFDLWEEVKGRHFYTTLVQMRAMKEGAEFAASQKDMERCSQYSKIAQDMDHRLQMFWNKARGYIEVTQDAAYDFGKDSGLDTCVVMASLHAGVEAGRWSVDNPQILLTHLAVVESMRSCYALSAQYKGRYGTPLGRYAEDVYDGVGKSKGNPWYLCTLYHAEYLYRLASRLESADVKVLPELHTFYSDLLISSLSDATDTIPSDSPVHKAITSGLRARADEFMGVVRDMKAPDGSMSEQFSRADGSPRGATKLTWSYAAFISAKTARDGLPIF